MIKLIDTAGDTILITPEQIAHRLRRMGSGQGAYSFEEYNEANQTFDPRGPTKVIQICVYDGKPDDKLPHYTLKSKCRRMLKSFLRRLKIERVNLPFWPRWELLSKENKVPTWARLKDGKTVRVFVE